MKAIEFQTKLHSADKIEIPLTYQNQFKPEQKVRIIVYLEEETIDDSWKKLATKQFFAGNTDEDSIFLLV